MVWHILLLTSFAPKIVRARTTSSAPSTLRPSSLVASRLWTVVNESGAEVTITKHGRPVAKLVPVGTRTAQSSILGACKESLIIVDDDDLVPSTADEWVEWEAQIDRGLDASGLA